MKKRFNAFKELLKFNFTTLMVFEVFYRVIGVLIIFPLAQLLIKLSINLSGYAYITNRLLIEFIQQPSTIMVFIVLGLLMAFYLVLEVLYLSYFFEMSQQRIKISVPVFLSEGFKHSMKVMKRHHVLLIFPSLFLFLVAELLQFSAVASTINIPQIILDQIGVLPYIQLGIILTILVIIIGFIFTLFLLPLFSTQNMPLKEIVKTNFKFLQKRKLKLFFEFLLLNILLNAILFLLYFIVIALVASFVFITRRQTHVLAFLLTVLYTIFLVIGFIASVTLMPINYALIEVWMHENKTVTVLKNKSLKFFKPGPIYRVPKRVFKLVWLVLAVIIIGLNIPGVFNVVSGERNPLSLFNYPEIIAHRGASFDAPENTLAAIEEAINQGADAIEIDIQETKDGVPVLFHDYSISRTTSATSNRPINQLTLEEVKALDAGSYFSKDFEGEKIPTLQEALEATKYRANLYIELKANNDAFNETVHTLIEDLNMINDVTILSFNVNQLETFKIYDESYETVLLLGTFIGDFERLVRNDSIDSVAFASSVAINNPQYIRRLHAEDKRAYVWTVNDKERLEMVVDYEIDGIITDVPLLAREVAYGNRNEPLFNDILKNLFE